MNDIQLLDAVERYIRGEMNPDERLHFENLRKTNAEVDQLVVEHTLFLQQMNQFGERQKFKATLNEVHTNLAEEGKIDSARMKGRAKVVYLWNRYKRVTAIAASIAGITAIGLTTLINAIKPPVTSSKETISLVKTVDDVKNDLEKVRQDQENIKAKIDKTTTAEDFPVARYNGTGFLIDPRGVMITNAHVVRSSDMVFVEDNKGTRYKAIVVKLDVPRDIAIIKIDDSRFKPHASLPYGIRKTGSKLAEPIFTLGFPKAEIVYGQGYLSAKTGYEGDTLSCQITVAANHGNSGGPVFNANGEVIGILSSKQADADGAVFAVQSKYIYKALDELKKNDLYRNVKMPAKSSIAGLDRMQQVEKLQNYVFIVKGN